MHITILGDIEGVCGISSWEQTGGGGPLYEEGRRLYTAEVNAAVRGCLEARAHEVVAMDGHGGGYPGGRAFMNWIPDQLEGGAEYVRGYRWGCYTESMAQDLTDRANAFPDGAGEDRYEARAVALLGAHSMAGTPNGVLNHTINADGWHGVTVNGQVIGEVGLLAATAGAFGVPVIFISGDQAACDELRAAVGPGLTTVAVKRGLGRYASRHMAPSDACAAIQTGLATAIGGFPGAWPKPVVIDGPVTIEVELASPDRAEALASQPNVELSGARTVRAHGDAFLEAWGKIWRPV